MKLVSGEGNSALAFKMLMFSLTVMILLSIFLPMFSIRNGTEDVPDYLSDVEDQYFNFTGSKPASESIWMLTGIYTPYGQDDEGNASDAWGYTDDGWLYGMRIINYTPSQYSGTNAAAYTTYYDEDIRAYRYTNDSTTVNKHNKDALYGSVVMDVQKQSNMFFTTAGKTIQDDGKFYYSFSGYRYAFQPIQKHYAQDQDGNISEVVPNTTSLSLIWYNYYGNTGISGQLIISGSDGGVAYLTAAEIVSAFNSTTSTSKFIMNFNGVDMILAIRLDPYFIANGESVENCYNFGYWAIMVSSRSVDASSYVAADYAFDPTKIFQTMIKILTFRADEYGLTGIASILATLLVVVPLFIALIVIGMDNYVVVIIAGIYLFITTFTWDFNIFG